MSKEQTYRNEDICIPIAIQEMQKSYEWQREGIDSIKTTARSIFATSSIVISIFGSLNLFQNQAISPKNIDDFNLAMGAIIFLYAILLSISVFVISPFHIVSPIKEDWGELYKVFTDKSKKDILREHLSMYTNAISDNRARIDLRGKLAIVSGVLLGVIIGLLFYTAWLLSLS